MFVCQHRELIQVRGEGISSRTSSRDAYSRAGSKQRCYQTSYSDPPDPYEEVKPNQVVRGFGATRNCKECGCFVANVSLSHRVYP